MQDKKPLGLHLKIPPLVYDTHVLRQSVTGNNSFSCSLTPHTRTCTHTHAGSSIPGSVTLNGTFQVYSNVFQENVADTVGAAVALAAQTIFVFRALQAVTVFQSK